MLTRRVCTLGVVVLVLMAEVSLCGSFEWFDMGETLGCRFTNETGSQVDGLLLVFEEAADLTSYSVVFGDMTPVMGPGRETRMGGWVAPFGEVFAEWASDGPRLLDAAWLLEGEVIESLCVGCPTARIWISPSSPVIGQTVTFASRSFDVYGDAIVRHLWEWDDGTTADGREAARTYESSGEYAVTLTVWDEGGLTGTETKTFTVFAEPQRFELLVGVSVSFHVPLTPGALPAGIRVYGHGIDIEARLEELPGYPYVDWVLISLDAREEFVAGTSVELTAEALDPGISFESWSGCSSSSGTKCTVVMDRDRSVTARFEIPQV
jgi:PKD repeat protein